MAGHIRRREIAAGTRYYPVLGIDGKQHTFGSYKTKRDALAKLREVERQVADGTFGQEDAITFSEMAVIWLESVKFDVKPSAYSDYEIQVRKHLLPYFAKKKIDTITPADVDRFRTAKAGETRPDGSPYSSRRVNKALVTLGAIFRYAVEHEYLDKSPTRFMKKVKEDKREMDFLTPDEIQRLLDACSPFLYPICFTAIMTGLRQAELFGLKWSDVDFDAGEIKVRRSYHPTHGFSSTKSEKGERTVVMSPALAGVLAYHKATTGGVTDDLVFRNKVGNPIDYHNVERREFHAALDRAGLRRIRWHDLRHTFAALMVANGEYPTKIQEQMGHADIGTTFNTYGHLMPDSSKGIGERLDSLVCPDGTRWPTGGLVRVK